MRVKGAKDLGNLVHDRRKALGWTQAALAKRAGVSRLWVNQVESGQGGASLARVLGLLSALGLVIDLDTEESVAPRDEARKASTRSSGSTNASPRTKMIMPKPRRLTEKGG